MSSKIGTILSLLFVALYVVLSADLITIQHIFSDLDAKSTSVAYLISKHGTVDDELINAVEDRYNVEFRCLSYCNSSPGDVVDFVISREYQPLFISREEITISVKRQAIISYYG